MYFLFGKNLIFACFSFCMLFYFVFLDFEGGVVLCFLYEKEFKILWEEFGERTRKVLGEGNI